MKTQEEKLKIFSTIQEQFTLTMNDIEKYFEDKSIPSENHSKDIQEKLNKLGNDLIGLLIQ